MAKTSKRLKRISLMKKIIDARGIQIPEKGQKCANALLEMTDILIENSFDPPEESMGSLIKKSLVDISAGRLPGNLFDLCLYLDWSGQKDNAKLQQIFDDNAQLIKFNKIEQGVPKGWQFHNNKQSANINDKRIIGDYLLQNIYKSEWYYKTTIQMADLVINKIEKSKFAKKFKFIFGGGTGFLTGLFMQLCNDKQNQDDELNDIFEFFKLGDVDIKIIPQQGIKESEIYSSESIKDIKKIVQSAIQQSLGQIKEQISSKDIDLGNDGFIVQPIMHSFRRQIHMSSEKSTTYYYPKQRSPWQFDSIDLYQKEKIVSVIFRVFLLVNIVDKDNQFMQKKLQVEFLDISIPIKLNHIIELPDGSQQEDKVSDCLNYFNKQYDYLDVDSNEMQKAVSIIYNKGRTSSN